MIKRILTTILAIIAIALSASAYDFMAGKLCYNINDDGKTATVTYESASLPSFSGPAYSALSGSVTIPSKVSSGGVTYTVTGIGNRAFIGCTGLTSVTFPNSIISIGEYAFYGCSGISSVTLPPNLTSIESYVFQDCSGLKSITIPSTVTSIGREAFTDCSSLASIDLPASVTSISVWAFARCSSLRSFVIPQGVKSIGYNLFYQCTGLKSVTIPATVSIIGSEAFYGCTALTSIDIPAAVTWIGSAAFSQCTALTAVNISDLAAWCGIRFDSVGANPLSVAHNLYLNGTKVENVSIPSTVTKIRDYAFSGGSNFTGIAIPATVTEIGQRAFMDCTGLESIVVPTSVTTVGRNAFAGCSGLKTMKWDARTCPDQIPYVPSTLPLNGLTGLTSIEFGHQVERIPRGLCYGLIGLKNVTIGRAVSFIGADAFSGCTSLERVSAYPAPDKITLKGGAAVFTDVPQATCELHVVPVYEADYLAADVWKDFSPIIGDLVVIDGDLNDDGSVDSSDVAILLEMVLTGGIVPIAADINADGALDSSDVSILLEMVLSGE